MSGSKSIVGSSRYQHTFIEGCCTEDLRRPPMVICLQARPREKGYQPLGPLFGFHNPGAILDEGPSGSSSVAPSLARFGEWLCDTGLVIQVNSFDIPK